MQALGVGDAGNDNLPMSGLRAEPGAFNIIPMVQAPQTMHWLPHTPHFPSLAPAFTFLWRRPWKKVDRCNATFPYINRTNLEIGSSMARKFLSSFNSGGPSIEAGSA